ncbi:MAG: outer membrane beta-barrel protein [bacterium]|nr:outer membrane beta-barrel protein [bacterium]
MNKTISLFVILLFACFSVAFAVDKTADLGTDLRAENQQLTQINNQIVEAQQNLQRLALECQDAQRIALQKRADADRAKENYDRASKNVDIIGSDVVVNFLTSYKTADQAARDAEAKQQLTENQKRDAQKKLDDLARSKREAEIQILKIKADLFDQEIYTPVWSEGYGEAILSEDKSVKTCQTLALDYARQDAIDKGGKLILQSITVVENFELAQDIIKTEAKVRVVESDLSGDYGKVIRLDQGGMSKFTARVRLKLQSIDVANPYKEQMDELLAGSMSPTVPVTTTQAQQELPAGEPTGTPAVVQPGGAETKIAAYQQSSSPKAQKVRFGIEGGLNLSNIYGSDAGLDGLKGKMGLLAGAFITFNLSNRFAIQPEILWTAKGFRQEYSYLDSSINATINVKYKWMLSYLEMPVYLKFSFPLGSSADYTLMIGPTVSCLLKPRYELKATAAGYEDYNESGKINDVVKLDYGLSAATGFDFNLGKIQLFVNARFSMSLSSFDDSPGNVGGPLSIKHEVITVATGIAF